MNLSFQSRYIEMLESALGEQVLAYLASPTIIEIMLNPDGRVFVEDLQKGKYLTETIISPAQSTNIIKLAAAYKKEVIGEERPMVACELPLFSARFQGWLPPVVEKPCFAIRKRAAQIFTLQNYVESGCLTVEAKQLLANAIECRQNIMVVGGTGSGKTTFANALLHELNNSSDRILIIEDLRELQVQAEDVVFMESTSTVSMRDLVKGALRMRPDRIIVGEVRDGSALDMLKAWNTGHPGGICTIHANSVDSAPLRLEDLIQEVVVTVPHSLILQAVDLFVYIEKTKVGLRKVSQLAKLTGYENGSYQLQHLL